MPATDHRPAPTRLRDPAMPGAPSRAAAAGPPGTRPTWVEVDLDAIAANTAALKAQAAAPQLMAVVKADGYGHGSVASARAALAGGADWLAVALVEEGLTLRASGIDAPILLLTEAPVSRAADVVAADLVPAAYTPAYVRALDDLGRHRGRPIDVHIKLDTGMRRVGVPPADAEDVLRTVRDASGLHLQGLWSHFAVADEPDHPFITAQAEAFAATLDTARRMGAAPDIAHLANTAGTVHLHDHHHDMVRPGLGIYGLEPAPGLAGATPLRPALSWWSRLSVVKELAAGEAVSYGLTWQADDPTVLGTVPAGYADGVTRALTNTGELVHRGRRVPIAGRVCMDQLCVDLGPTAEAEADDDVALIGSIDGASVTADDWAAWLGTINYEVTCGVGARVPRVYTGTTDRTWAAS